MSEKVAAEAVMREVRGWESEGLYPERGWLESVFGASAGRVIDELIGAGDLVATDVFVTTPEVAARVANRNA